MTLNEIATDESGNVLWNRPYPFRRLFRVGQDQVVDSVRYLVLRCGLDGDTVRTVLRKLPPLRAQRTERKE